MFESPVGLKQNQSPEAPDDRW